MSLTSGGGDDIAKALALLADCDAGLAESLRRKRVTDDEIVALYRVFSSSGLTPDLRKPDDEDDDDDNDDCDVVVKLSSRQCQSEYLIQLRMELEEWRVTELDVSFTNIACEYVANVLLDERSCCIRSLNLAGNEIGHELAVLAPAFAAEHCQLTALDLSQNDLGDALPRLGDALPRRLAELNVSHNWLDDDSATAIVRWDQVRRSRGHHHACCLLSLNVEHNSLGGMAMLSLVNLVLTASSTSRTGRSFRCLGNAVEMPSYTLLPLQWHTLAGRQQLQPVVDLSVDLGTAQDLQSFAMPLSHACCRLTSLSLRLRSSHSGGIEQAFADFVSGGLAHNISLTALLLDGFSLRGRLVRMLTRALDSGCASLVSLSLCCCDVDSAGAAALAELIDNATAAAASPSTSKLTMLDLMDNDIDASGARALLRAWQRSPWLQLVDVNANLVPETLEAQFALTRHQMQVVRACLALLPPPPRLVVRRGTSAAAIHRLPVELIRLLADSLLPLPQSSSATAAAAEQQEMEDEDEEE